MSRYDLLAGQHYMHDNNVLRRFRCDGDCDQFEFTQSDDAFARNARRGRHVRDFYSYGGDGDDESVGCANGLIEPGFENGDRIDYAGGAPGVSSLQCAQQSVAPGQSAACTVVASLPGVYDNCSDIIRCFMCSVTRS
jgi:hypothetical protein